jgi:hypothetical protein
MVTQATVIKNTQVIQTGIIFLTDMNEYMIGMIDKNMNGRQDLQGTPGAISNGMSEPKAAA